PGRGTAAGSVPAADERSCPRRKGDAMTRKRAGRPRKGASVGTAKLAGTNRGLRLLGDVPPDPETPAPSPQASGPAPPAPAPAGSAGTGSGGRAGREGPAVGPGRERRPAPTQHLCGLYAVLDLCEQAHRDVTGKPLCLNDCDLRTEEIREHLRECPLCARWY